MMFQQYSYAPYQAQPTIRGRRVRSPEEIGVGDVPMDGTVALFPADDGTVIWSRRWTPSGTIEAAEYRLHQSPPESGGASAIDALTARVEALEAAMAKPRRKARDADDQAD